MTWQKNLNDQLIYEGTLQRLKIVSSWNNGCDSSPFAWLVAPVLVLEMTTKYARLELTDSSNLLLKHSVC